MELTSSRSGAEISGGAVLVGIGIAAFLDLPPPWWSGMPVWLVGSGVTMGAILFSFGLAFVVIGVCRSFPGHRPCKAVVNRWGQMWTNEESCYGHFPRSIGGVRGAVRAGRSRVLSGTSTEPVTASGWWELQ